MKQAEDGIYLWNCVEESKNLNEVDGSLNEEDMKLWTEYLDIGTDYAQIQQSIDKQDKHLQEAAFQGKGLRILKQDLWETMVSFVISQNNNIPRIKKSIEALCSTLGNPIQVVLYQNPTIQKEEKQCQISYDSTISQTVYTFPSAQTLASADLSPYRLGYRERYVQGLAKDVAEGRFSLEALCEMDEKESKKTLKSVTGIGEKVADCIRLFGLHQLGAFPVDTWIKKMQSEYYGGHFPVEQYPDSAGVMQQYLFELARKGKI
jgi:N-glycosylase/DNA lyase